MNGRMVKLLRVLNVGALTVRGVEIELFHGRYDEETRNQALGLLADAIVQGFVEKKGQSYYITEEGENVLRQTRYDRGHSTSH